MWNKMSANTDDEKTEPGKSFPLDLASKLTSIKTIDAKPSLVSSQQLRNMRLVAHPSSSSGQIPSGTPTIITTNIVPQVLKQGNFYCFYFTIWYWN